MQEQTTNFLLSLLTDGEELRKFPKEFVDISVKWLRPWLIKNDPVVEAVLVSRGNHALKAKVLAAKLPGLQQNEQFIKELGRRMADYERMKNVILKSKVDVKGNASIGDKTKDPEDSKHDAKNAIIGSDVKVDGDLSIGDDHHHTSIDALHTGTGDIVKGSKVVNTNNYYGTPEHPLHSDKSSIKAAVQRLIAKGDLEAAIAQIVDYSETNAPSLYSETLQLSGRFHTLRNKVNKGVLSESEISLENNKIQAALIDLLSKL
ncbi:MAG: hypothetical protein CV087_19665 [Candidatus Brocadia sp. WS118]|nr:MAG: hypothetical protein CV087_19665 [Candidatus Brocadia sp. WS118]